MGLARNLHTLLNMLIPVFLPVGKFLNGDTVAGLSGAREKRVGWGSQRSQCWLQAWRTRPSVPSRVPQPLHWTWIPTVHPTVVSQEAIKAGDGAVNLNILAAMESGKELKQGGCEHWA